MQSVVRSVYLLDGGTLEVESSVVVPGRNFGQLMKVPVPMFLLDTNQGYVLIDTGLNPGVIDDPKGTWGESLAAAARPRMAPRQHPYAQLARLGLSDADLTSVVYTHLHHDHAGGAALFPKARHVVQRLEWEWALSPDSFAAGAYVRSDFDRHDLAWTLSDGDQNLMPGLQLMLTPGHSPGHQSIILWDTPDLGTLILAGDAINCQANVDADLPPGISTDARAAVRSMNSLLALAEAVDATLIFGHDMNQFEALQKLPNRLGRDNPSMNSAG